MSVILETGRKARIPFFLEKVYVNLYSIEELCYCFVENAEMIDRDVVNDKLTRWLEEQCGLKQLAHALFALQKQNGPTDAYVETVLEYTGLYPSEVIARAGNLIKSSAGLSPYEKQKAKADHMLENKRYLIALERYEALLSQLPSEENVLRGKVLHNMGVINARLFLFENAQKDFWEAYRESGNTDSLKQFLTAKRMLDNDKDYVAYIAGHPELHELSLEVERTAERTAAAFDTTQENRMLFTLRVFKEEGGGSEGSPTPYYDEIEKLTDSLKTGYRENMT